MSWVDIPKMERFLQNDEGIWWGFKVSGSSSNPPSEVSLTHTHAHTHKHTPFLWWIRQSTHLGSRFCTGNWQSAPLEGWRALLKVVVMTDLDGLLPYSLWEYNFRGKIWDEGHHMWKGLNRINNVYGCRNKNRSLKMFLSSTWA